MLGIKVKEIYKYENAVLESGAKVTANEVTIQDGKVANVNNGNVTVEGKTFGFSIYNYGVNGEKTYNLNNVPADIDGQAIVKEFIEFAENDIV